MPWSRKHTPERAIDNPSDGAAPTDAAARVPRAMRLLLNQRVPSADGTELATDVFLPDGAGSWPVLLTRTPYGRAGAVADALTFTEDGYVRVIQDCRGKYDSEGTYRPLLDDGDDGQATLDWLANQSWCNGRIGMIGLSYLGIVQAPAATTGHAALKCIAPGVAPARFFRDWIRHDGCFALANAVRWAVTHATSRTRLTDTVIDWQRLYAQPTLDRVFDAVGCEAPCLRAWVEHDVEDDYWRSIDQGLMHAGIQCPGLHQGGWFDHISRGQFQAYRGIRRAPQRLLIGPWGHALAGGECGDWQFGEAAAFSRAAFERRCLDLWLKDIDDGIVDEPPVKLFLLGRNRWMDFPDWPVPGADQRPLHLRAAGRLSDDSPAVNEMPDRYRYDPRDPLPSCGGPIYRRVGPPARFGPVDQRPILGRHDVLHYGGDPLPAELVVIGEPVADLWIASNVADTDLIAKLCVAEPCGREVCLTVGALRLRYRAGFDRTIALPRDEPVNACIRMLPIAYAFPAGSRIGLIVTSSSFPRILPHPNTMAPTWKETRPRPAQISVLHEARHPSRLVLPVVEA